MVREQCPRCKGEVRLDRDQYGWYEQCLMCGYLRDMQVLVEHGHEVKQHEKIEAS